LSNETVTETKNDALSNAYKGQSIEDAIRERWKVENLKEKIRQRFIEKGAKMFGYVDGPPTLNGEPHMGHLRGRIMKDLWYRFETIRGNFIDFRGGWDCQGLPVELQAEKELGLSGNKTANLKRIGEEAMVDTCKKMVLRYHEVWKASDEQIGLLIDDENAFWTYRDGYIEREWHILRAAWENKILSEGYRVTPFCPSCQTSLSAAEVALGGYENLEDPSMYFKMKIREKDSTFLVAWTTMPFTVITDELVGVKPEAEYCYVVVQPSLETWIVGADRLDALMKELKIQNYEVKRKVKGSELEGVRYDYPLADIIPEQGGIDWESTLVHSIVAEEFVDVTTGSGLVHMSPANGEDDFEVAQRRGLPIFNPIDDQAVFTEKAGAFAGLFVRDSDQKIADALKEKGALLRYGRLKHEYPICWRSGHRLVWLARREYFYFVDRLKELAIDAATETEYFYDPPGNRFVEIVKEKRPWCISRERVWGTPLPIWRCESCKEKLGLFTRDEIVSKAKSLPDGPNFELHRPWIDRIVVSCPKCGADMNREPFVLDTWHNSGAAPYAAHTDKEYHDLVPMPFLTEGIDQSRGWAYSLLIENVILTNKAQSPYEAFLFMGHVLDENGEKLSKSKGNFIPVRELLKAASVDLVRLYLNWKASPIDSINFSKAEMITRPYQILNTLYHMHIFYDQNARFDGFQFSSPEAITKRLQKSDEATFKKQDRWLLSKLGLLIDQCTESYQLGRYSEAVRAIETFVIDLLSQTYVPIVRGEMWEETEESKSRRQIIYSVLGLVLYQIDVMLHPVSPFVTDYLSRECFGVDSLMLKEWPESEARFRDNHLEAEFDLLSNVVSLTNSARMKGKVKRRWPLRKAVYLMGEAESELILPDKELLLEQVNLVDVEFETDPTKTPIKVSVKPNFELVAPRAKSRMNELSSKLSKTDAAWLFNRLSIEGKVRLPEMPDFELTESDVIFDFSPTQPGYVVAENYGVVIALDITRDDGLIAEGTMRDLARNLQSLRKEKGFNPTDVLATAKAAGLGKQIVKLLESKKEQLAFLVRVRKVELYSDFPSESESWSKAEIDGVEIRIDVG